MSSWYNVSAPENDVVVSTRVRLARNLKGMPFPSRMTAAQMEELKLKVKKVICESNTPFAKTLNYIDYNKILLVFLQHGMRLCDG